VRVPRRPLGEITGQITDSSGRAVPEAAITLKKTNTDGCADGEYAGGDYSFLSLPPGATAFRWRNLVQASESSSVTAGAANGAPGFALTIGQVSESVVVEATAVALQPRTRQVGRVERCREQTHMELPLNGVISAIGRARTQCEPRFRPQRDRRAHGRAAIARINRFGAGQRTCSTLFTLDGVKNTDPNFNTYVVLPSIDALQEFKVQTGVYRRSSATTRRRFVLTKSGAINIMARSSNFCATTCWTRSPIVHQQAAGPRTRFKWNQFGFEVDGPCLFQSISWEDKLFFLATMRYSGSGRTFKTRLHGSHGAKKRRFQRFPPEGDLRSQRQDTLFPAT